MISERPIVAIVGSCRKVDLGEDIQSTVVESAAISIGRNLAENGFRLLVFTSGESYVARHVVAGYLSHEPGLPGSIIDAASAEYPTEFANLYKGEHTNGIFQRQPDHHSDWEIGFFRFLRDRADALLVIGGGHSAIAAAMTFIDSGKPLYCVPCFGGAAKIAWKYLSAVGSSLLSQEDIFQMGAYCPEIGGNISGILRKQFDAKIDPNSNRVFIVHGHNHGFRDATARLTEKFGLVPIILAEQPSLGQTIIEKFESHSNVASAIVILSADDRGGTQKSKLSEQRARARQNVILELGYFVGSLGRKRVFVLYEPTVEIPSDYLGVIYIKLDENNAWKRELGYEMHSSGIPIDPSALVSHAR